MKVNYDKLETLISIGLMIFALTIYWLKIDKLEIVANTGFICYGLFKLFDAIKNGYYKQFNFGLLRIIVPIVVILLACDNILTEKFNIVAIAVTLFLLDSTNSKKLFESRESNNI